MKKYKNTYLGLTMICMVFIFYMSDQPSSISSTQSDKVIDIMSKSPVLSSGINRLINIGKVDFVVRKFAHMFLYFILAILIYLALKNRYGIKAYIYSLIGSFVYACTDEIHQLFIPGRSGEFKDVLVDSLGALIGLTIVFIINNLLLGKEDLKKKDV